MGILSHVKRDIRPYQEFFPRIALKYEKKKNNLNLMSENKIASIRERSFSS